MKLRFNRSDQYVFGGVRLADRLPYFDSPFTEGTMRADPIWTLLSLSIGFTQGYDPKLLCGVKGGLSPLVFAVAEPRPSGLPYNALQDNRDYGRGLWSFFRGFGDRTGRSVALSRENRVIHHRILGDVEYVPESASRWSSSTQTEINGVVIPSIPLDAFQRVSFIDTFRFLNGSATAHWAHRGGSYLYLEETLKAIHDELDAGEYNVGTGFWIDGAFHGISAKSMAYTLTDKECLVKYVIRYRKYDVFMHVVSEMMREVSILIQLERDSGRTERSGLDNTWGSCYDLNVTVESSYHSGQAFLGHQLPSGWIDLLERGPLSESGYWVDVVEGVGYISNDCDTSAEIISHTINHVEARLAQFCNDVEKSHDALTAGAFYSTSDALHDWIDLIDTNMIEFFAEAREVAAMLPNLSGLISLYKDVRKLRLLKAGVRLLDIVSDAELYWNFGLKPNLQVTKEFVTKHDQLFSRSPASLSGKKTLYGRKTHVHEKDGVVWRIELTSKVRLVIPESLLLWGIFGLNAMGLLPTPGNLWDVGRLTWLVDMVFGIGQKLKAVDDQGLLLLLDAGVGTHSYRVVQDDILGSLDELHLRSVGKRNPLGQYFYRGVSTMLPSLRGCQIDYSPPSKGSWEVMLAFIYKIMK